MRRGGVLSHGATDVGEAPAVQGRLPVFLINLDRSSDRLEWMLAELQRSGLEFVRFSAVDGRDALPEWLRAQFPETAHLSSGEVGCYASHLSVYLQIARSALPYAMILEDDAMLADDLPSIVQEALSMAPLGWDYIRLSGHFKRAVYSVGRLSNGRHLVRHTLIPNTTVGYLVSRQGAEKMLVPSARVRPIDRDIKFAWLRKLEVFGIYPSPVCQRADLAATITSRQLEDYPVNVDTGKGLASRFGAYCFTASKLGIAGYAACWRANVELAMRRRLRKSKSGIVPVVTASA
jgi:glycosyl transferase family 25